jgi:hypothetical protein
MQEELDKRNIKIELTGSKSKLLYNRYRQTILCKKQPDVSDKKELDWSPKVNLNEGY